MTLPELIFVLAAIWLFIAIGMYVARRKENKNNLNSIKDAHETEQTILDKSALESLPELDDIDWAELGIQRSEQPFIYLHTGSN